MLASLVATCKMSDVNPVSYIAQALRVILDGHPASRIEKPHALALPKDVEPRCIGIGRALTIYALHEPEVDCISKGKVRARYQFGCKVSVATTLDEGFVVGMRSFRAIPPMTATL